MIRKKKCSRCKTTQPINNFYRDYSWCKKCSCLNQKKYGDYKRKYMEKYRKEKPHILKNWRSKNKEHIREYDKKRYHKNPDYKSSIIKRRKRGIKGKHTTSEWENLKKKHGYKCTVCRKRRKLTKDHVVPISQGGTDNIKNIKPLCSYCNASKGTKGKEWYKEKLLENLK